jgi:hypothetical protein
MKTLFLAPGVALPARVRLRDGSGDGQHQVPDRFGGWLYPDLDIVAKPIQTVH